MLRYLFWTYGNKRQRSKSLNWNQQTTHTNKRKLNQLFSNRMPAVEMPHGFAKYKKTLNSIRKTAQEKVKSKHEKNK